MNHRKLATASRDNAAMHDVTVIGAGPNGLAAAIVLQQAGRSVVIYEGNNTIGGAAATKAQTLPGFRHDLGAAVHPLGAASPFFRSLPLYQHGLEWVQPEIPLAHPLDGGRAVVMSRSVDLTAQSLGEDGSYYQKVMGGLSRNWDRISDAVFGPLLRIPSHPTVVAGMGLRGLVPAEVAQKRLRTEEGRALLAGLAAHAPMPLSKVGNTAVALVLGALAHVNGWPIARGGSQNIVDALASVLLEAGGSIETGHAVEDLTDIPRTDLVLFDTGPRALAAIAGDRIGPRTRRSYQRYRQGTGSFKVDFALDGPVPWAAAECRKAGTLHVGGTAEEIAAAEVAAWRGEHTENPFLIVSQPTVADPSRAPQDKHVLWTYCHVPAGCTVDMTEVIERQIERFAPGFRNLILDRKSMDPADLEAWNPNLVGGDIAGGRTDRLGMLFRPQLRIDPYRAGPGLYICSSATPPGPGVHGMSGFHAARSALRK